MAGTGERPPERVWYVAYGSNLLRERFLHYLAPAGSPRSDAYGHHLGSADDSPPADDRRVTLSHPVVFAGHSVRWDGPVSFLDPVADDAVATPGRAYLIAGTQLVDLVRQENRAPGYDWRPEHLPDAPHEHRALPVDTGSYDALLRLPDLDGVPALALTTTQVRPTGAAPARYLEVMRLGLRELGLTDGEIDAHLGA